jgi:hypothetical protein
VKRNLDRFPEDFMFQLTKEENECLRFQSCKAQGTASQMVDLQINGQQISSVNFYLLSPTSNNTPPVPDTNS